MESPAPLDPWLGPPATVNGGCPAILRHNFRPKNGIANLEENGDLNGDTPDILDKTIGINGGNGLLHQEKYPNQNAELNLVPSCNAIAIVPKCDSQHSCGLSDLQCPYENEDPDSRENYSCGLWSIRPKWLQPFANKKAFLAVFCLTSVLQGMYYTYFVSVLTTIEKLYQIQSKTTGIIMSATEIGQIGGALLLTYYGGHGHRPRWIACGMLVFAFASILCSTPHFFFGGDMILPASIRAGNPNATLLDLRTKLCYPSSESSRLDNGQRQFALSENTSLGLKLDSVLRISPFDEGGMGFLNEVGDSVKDIPETGALWSRGTCDSQEKSNQQGRITHMVLAVFFVSLLFIGIGATAVYTLGIPYIDDNVATRESPLYFGITIGVRIFGPVFGFLLGSFCTGVYVNFPFEDPIGINTDDPQWIGAWWLGVFIVGAALILTALPMMAFPKKLPSPNEPPGSVVACLHHHHYQHHPRHHNHLHLNYEPETQELPQKEALLAPEEEPNHVTTNGHIPGENGNALVKSSSTRTPVIVRSNKKPILKDFPSAMRRLLKNDILLCRTASSVLHILPIAGLYTFLPKYLESQFQLTATKANMIAGMAGILVMGAGIFASGVFMRKVKPNARFVARWIALAALAYALGMVLLMWLGCPMNNYVGLNSTSDPIRPNGDLCNATCSCRSGEFAPICTSEGVTYLSPCLAGCTKVSGSPKEQYVYKDCHCLSPEVTAINGYCPLQCDNLVWYTIIFSLFVLIHSTSEVGSMLLTLRCVDPQDKAMALGLISFAIGLFGNVPCPIIYGAIVDSACLFWENNCGKPGACRIYDPVRFRIVFHGVTAVIMFAAFVVDAIIWYKSSDIQFQEDDDAVVGNCETEPMNNGEDANFETSV